MRDGTATERAGGTAAGQVAAGGGRATGASHAPESAYREVFDAIDQAFHRCEVIVDAAGRAVDYRLLEVNRAWARMTRMDPATAVGRTARELVPDAPEAWIQACGRAGLARESVRLEQEIPALGMWYDVHLMPFGAPESRQFLATAADITARKQAEAERERLAAAVATEREWLRSVVLQAPGPLALLVGPEHRFELVNEAYKRVSGGGRDVTGLTPRTAFPELAGSGIHELFDRVYETGEPWDGPETLVRYDRDGTGVQDTWFNLRLQPLRGADGRVGAIFNFAVDVTEQVLARREVERLLAESERARAAASADAARAEAVLGSIADAFYLLDRDWRFTYVNDAAEPLLQTTRERLLGRTLWEAFPDVAGSPFEAPYRAAMDEGRVTAAEAYFPPLETWFDVRTYPWPGGLMVHFRDVGARKAAEAERDRLLAETEAARREADAARAEAEAANRAKSEFLAVMSHELRTPLNAIGGYAELIELGIRGPVTVQQREDLRRVQASQRHLLGLINEVLNYAKLETGAVHYEVAPVRVCDALAGAEALVAPQARARGLTLTVPECPPHLAVRADAEKLRQILANLLSNAVKFTDAGGEVRLAYVESEERVLLTVRDSGIGIAADQLERIFDPFVQVRTGLTRPHEGTGLGLAISRDLARGMGGDLTVESVVGGGSAFTLALPRG